MGEHERIPEEIDEIAKFLAFFAATRTYRPLDKLSRPFSFGDIVSTIQEALREADVSYKNPSKTMKKKIEGREIELRYIEDPRVGTIRVPRLPRPETVKRFYELCRENLYYAKMAAALALTYSPYLMERGE